MKLLGNVLRFARKVITAIVMSVTATNAPVYHFNLLLFLLMIPQTSVWPLVQMELLLIL
jgi:hypothetical protein